MPGELDPAEKLGDIMPEDLPEKLRVAIIGAGAAGLAACHRLLQHVGRFSPVIFEQGEAVGGTWVYTDAAGLDCKGQPVHSSMYDNCRTNLPKEVMAFLDFPFPSGGSSYVGRRDVLRYLNDYCDAFGIRNYVQFLTRVATVAPVDGGGHNNNWEITTENLANRTKTTGHFHAVLLCNGHFTAPSYPVLPGAGLSSFKGRILHSRDYRVPDIFTGKTVVFLGAGNSGMDIALEAAAVAKHVYLSHDLPARIESPLPVNVTETAWVSECDSDGFRLTDGGRIDADVTVVCTGYNYDFPFVAPSCGLEVKDHRVTPLYKHLFHCRHPTMVVLSVQVITSPFVVSECQAQAVAATLLDPTLLPSADDMLADTERELQRRRKAGEPPRHFHRFADRIWPYLDDLMALVGLPSLPPARGRLHRLCLRNRARNYTTFRQLNYEITETEVFYRSENEP